MKDRTVQICFIAVCLVLAAAMQEMLPAFGGAKAPLLLVTALHAAFRDDDEQRPGGIAAPTFRWLLVAFAAGLFEDALNGLSICCCTLFTLLVCTTARFSRPFVRDIPRFARGLGAAMVAAPLHELWLSVWGVLGPGGTLVVRFFAAALPAAVAGAVLFAVLPHLEWHVGFDGPEPERRRR